MDIKVVNNRATIKSGKSRFTLSTLAADEYPRVEDISEVVRIEELTNASLKNLLHKSQFCMAMQDVRYYLTVYYWKLKEMILGLSLQTVIA